VSSVEAVGSSSDPLHAEISTADRRNRGELGKRGRPHVLAAPYLAAPLRASGRGPEALRPRPCDGLLLTIYESGRLLTAPSGPILRRSAATIKERDSILRGSWQFARAGAVRCECLAFALSTTTRPPSDCTYSRTW